MCLAIPLKIIGIKDNWATVRSASRTCQVDLSLVKNVKVGDFILTHGGLALNKIDRDEAAKILKIIQTNHQHYDHQ